MINIVLLEEAMENRGVSKGELCRKLGLSEVTFGRKIRRGIINTEEAEKIRRILELEEPAKIFFADELTLKVKNGKKRQKGGTK